jgi:hypothetical protein
MVSEHLAPISQANGETMLSRDDDDDVVGKFRRPIEPGETRQNLIFEETVDSYIHSTNNQKTADGGNDI